MAWSRLASATGPSCCRRSRTSRPARPASFTRTEPCRWARREQGTARSDFFVCIGDASYLDANLAAPGDGAGFAAFGHVVEGMDVVRKILALPTSPTEGAPEMAGQVLSPPVPIISARRARAAATAPTPPAATPRRSRHARTEAMSEIHKFSLRYDPGEDRLAWDLEADDGGVTRLWLTQRLCRNFIEAIIPVLTKAAPATWPPSTSPPSSRSSRSPRSATGGPRRRGADAAIDRPDLVRSRRARAATC